MADLPEPEWITLSESARRAMRTFDSEPPVVETALVAAFHDGKIRTRGRCRTWFRYDWLYDLAKSIWDRTDVDWQGNGFTIPSEAPGRRIHIFSDVVVHREDLEEWINSALLDSQHESQRAKPSKVPRRRGRKPGSGSYEKDDAPLIEEMGCLIAEGKAASTYAAAMQIVDKAKGGGAPESKARRLVDRYNDELNSI